uniref:HEPN/Toprim-associated domain-containing protein n=1 Tax=Silanimonas sp. TaxID=1929290 RepID=UPI0037CAB969
MGTMIYLAVGKLEVDWGKNNFFSDHGALFQASDFKPISTYEEDEHDPESEPVARIAPGLGKPLRHVRDRLELMGYTLRAIEHHYGRLHRLHGMTEKPIPFITLRRALARVDVTKVSGIYREDYDPGEFVRKEIIRRLALNSERHNYYLSGPGACQGSCRSVHAAETLLPSPRGSSLLTTASRSGFRATALIGS